MNKISFLGDISLNDDYNYLYQKGERPFEEVKDLLFNSTFVVGNLECFAESDFGENELKVPCIKTNPRTLNYLNDLNIGLALLANNHVFDSLEDGFRKTIEFLDNNGIAHIGAAFTAKEAEEPYIKIINGQSVCFLNYVTKDTNPCLPENSKVYLNWFNEKKIVLDIQKYKKKRFKIILCLHWGGCMEGSMYPHKKLPLLARSFIDSGADIIIGGHSHTLQPFEIYKEKYIFYSLGNFCFSDVYVNKKKTEFNKKRTNPSIVLNLRIIDGIFKIEYDRIINVKNFIKKDIDKKAIKQINYFKEIRYKSFVWMLYYFFEKKIFPIYAYFFANDRKLFKQIMKLRLPILIKHMKKFFSYKIIS